MFGLKSVNQNEGFSLIEQLFALVILSSAVLLIAPFLAVNLKNIKDEDFKVKTSNLAQEMVESAKGSPFEDLQDGTYETGGETSPEPATSSFAVSYEAFKTKLADSSYIPGGSGTLIVQPATGVTTSTDIKEVVVEVYWTEGSVTKSYELPTYIYNVSR